MARILVVDDDSMMLNLFERILKRLSHEVLTAMSGRRGLEVYRRDRPAVTILALNLPDMNGIQVLTEMRAVDPRARVIIWTGAGTGAFEQEARQRGVTEFLVKGFSLHELGAALNRVLPQEHRAVSAGSPSRAQGRTMASHYDGLGGH